MISDMLCGLYANTTLKHHAVSVSGLMPCSERSVYASVSRTVPAVGIICYVS